MRGLTSMVPSFLLPTFVGLAALAGLIGFYLVAWKRGHRGESATDTLVTSPPHDLSPAGMRFIMKMGTDDRAFAAALVDMAVRGHVRIVEREDRIRIERLPASAPLPRDEEAVLRELAEPGERILIDPLNKSKFSLARRALEQTLRTGYEGRLFNRNWGVAIVGALLFLGSIWLTSAAVVLTSRTVELMRLETAAGLLVLTLLFSLLAKRGRAGKCLLRVLAFVSGVSAVALGAPIVPAAIETGWWLPLLLPALALPLVVSAFWWIAAPTRAGRAVLDRIEGFRHYLSITERERLDRLAAPEDTPELFERYLPYAIALGVEKRWAERFAGILAAAAAQGRQGPGWYSGSSDPWLNPGRFVESVGSSLSSAINSASRAPGSSSGSAGGGK